MFHMLWVLCRVNISTHAFQFNYRLLELGGGEYSQTTSVSTSLLWKFRWHPQAAQVRASLVPSSPLAMNSLQPSTAYPPILAAWFFWHSAYRTLLIADDDVVQILVDPSLFTTTCLFFMTFFFLCFFFCLSFPFQETLVFVFFLWDDQFLPSPVNLFRAQPDQDRDWDDADYKWIRESRNGEGGKKIRRARAISSLVGSWCLSNPNPSLHIYIWDLSDIMLGM